MSKNETDREFVTRILNTIHNPSTTRWDYAELKELCDRLLAADAKLNEPVGEIKRYMFSEDKWANYPTAEMIENGFGEWVKYDDHVKAMRAKAPFISHYFGLLKEYLKDNISKYVEHLSMCGDTEGGFYSTDEFDFDKLCSEIDKFGEQIRISAPSPGDEK